MSACRSEAPARVVVVVDSGVIADVEVAAVEAAAPCDEAERAHMAWYLVRDRHGTTYDPGVYPMLWLVRDVVKMYARVWLPAENATYPRAIKFSRCSAVTLARPIKPAWKTLTAIRCEGARPMTFAAAENESGDVVVVQSADAIAWTVVAPDSPERYRSSCTRVESPELSAEPYNRDVTGPRTFP